DPAVNDADHWATAEVLAATVQKLGDYDLVLAGRQSVDWDMGVVGSTVAEILGIPIVTIAKQIDYAGDKVTVERVLLDGFETVEAPTPCVVTVSNELGEPRYPQLRQIMQAAKKEVKAWTLADLGISAPQNRVNIEALYVPDTSVETEVIEGETAQEKAATLAQRLSDAKLI
ncbi:MAG: electron transfer flavoprotein subunit beta/FixA family protein, partial [Chloroflexi bacterium]|nr:electron transfer flavoprotein subunit beta/FixA family protein [Chloroflexota bacterium]